MYSRLVLLFFSFLFVSCSGLDSNDAKQNSFYYWKLGSTLSRYEYDETDEPYYGTDTSWPKAASLGVDHFYIHYMDVDWSENMKMPIPLADLSTYKLRKFPLQGHTPVIYITNRVFERMPEEWCDTLVSKVNARIADISYGLWQEYRNQMYDSFRKLTQNTDRTPFYTATREQVFSKVNEIQIDCDWTGKTKDKYFLFLRKLKKASPGKKISVTVRMYPYKYPDKMGVPPVDAGVLMCYNLGSINKSTTSNSVFDLKEFRKYLDAKIYPLPLDVALPIFGWYAWFRGPQFKGIIYGDAAKVRQLVFEPVGGNNYRVKDDTIIQNKYFREGDVLRLEYPDAKELEQAAALVTKQVPNYKRIIFYHWNGQDIDKYEQTIRSIYHNY